MEREKRLEISIHSLMAARNCPKKEEYSSLHILDTREQSRYRKELLKIQGELLGDPKGPQKVDAFIRQNVKREWYRMRAQYHVLLEEEAAYHQRLASFFVGRKRVAGYRQWSVPVFLSFGGRQIDAVHGHVHAVLEEEGVHTAVVLSDGTPVYSAQARKQENRPEYAPELIGAYLGLRMEYGRNMKVSLVYLSKSCLGHLKARDSSCKI